MHGKATEVAIVAMGYLARCYDGGKTNISAAEIAKARGLQRPFVSKVLTDLARADLVIGIRGPGGGFTLARPPTEILLNEISELFERASGDDCPFGGGVCGVGEKCPLHDQFALVRSATNKILHKTSLGVFQKNQRRTKS